MVALPSSWTWEPVDLVPTVRCLESNFVTTVLAVVYALKYLEKRTVIWQSAGIGTGFD